MATFKIIDTTQPGCEPHYEHAPDMETAALNFLLMAGLSIEEVKDPEEKDGATVGTTEASEGREVKS